MSTSSKSVSSRKGSTKSTTRKARPSGKSMSWGIRNSKSGNLVRGENGVPTLYRNRSIARNAVTDGTEIVRVNVNISK